MIQPLPQKESPPIKTDPQTKESPGQVFLALGVGAVIAASVSILLVSGFFVLRRMLEGTYSLIDAAHVGDYWGGHLSALALAFLALSLGMQARELKLQRLALDAQAEESKRTRDALEEEKRINMEQRRIETFKAILEGIEKQGEQITGFVIEYDKEYREEIARTPIVGMVEINRKLQSFIERIGLSVLEVVNVSAGELEAYMKTINELEGQLKQVKWNLDVSPYTILLKTCKPQVLVDYYEKSKKAQGSLFAAIQSWEIGEQELEGLKEFVSQGWWFESQEIQNKFMMIARIETAGTPKIRESGLHNSAAESAKALIEKMETFSQETVST